MTYPTLTLRWLNALLPIVFIVNRNGYFATALALRDHRFAAFNCTKPIGNAVDYAEHYAAPSFSGTTFDASDTTPIAALMLFAMLSDARRSGSSARCA